MHHVAVYTEQWLGYISSLFGDFSLCYCSVEVCSDSCSMRKAYFFRIIKDSGMRLSLWLIYHHQNNIMNIPHFTTKYCGFFLFSGGKYQITIKYWNGVLAGLCWWRDKDGRKQTFIKKGGKKQQNLIIRPSAEKKKNKMLSLISQNFKHFISFLDIVFLQLACHMLCAAPSYHYPCGSPFVPFTWRHLQWGHIYRTPTLVVHNPPGQKWTSVSKWAIVLIFVFSFSLLSPSLLPPDEGWSP